MQEWLEGRNSLNWTSLIYQQIPLSEESKQYLIINTHKGIFRYNRLPFGVQSAPASFNVPWTVCYKIPGTVVYMDNILVTGRNETEHLQNLETVLTCIENKGLTQKKPKCKFMMETRAL